MDSCSSVDERFQSTRRAGHYQYTPLAKAGEIRCLVLERGSKNQPLVCNLRNCNLYDDSPPLFEALSYVWGAPTKDHMIICDGGWEVAITSNLDKCLRQVRLPDRERMLWADSICINQMDDAEKAHQVRLMGEIYTRAERVLIALGGDDEAPDDGQTRRSDSGAAASLLHDTNTMIQATLAESSGGWDSFPWPEDHDPLLTDQRWESVGRLLTQPWFKRGWVVQEAGLAKTVQIYWGESTKIPWIELIRSYSWVVRRASQVAEKYGILVPGLHLDLYDVRHPHESRTFHQEFDFFTYKELDILQSARDLSLTDNRDRIYAFVALPGAADLQGDFEISYQKDSLEVYRDFACWHVRKTQSLGLLMYVDHDEQTIAADFPSWVPQWHFNQYQHRISLTGEEGSYITSITWNSGIPAVIDDNRALRVRSLLFDSIAIASECFDQGSTELDDVASVWKIFRSKKGAPPTAYVNFSPLLAFMNALTLGRDYQGSSPELSTASNGAYMLALSSEDNDGSVIGDPSLKPFIQNAESAVASGGMEEAHRSIASNLHNRKIVMTRRGYFGVVPGVAREGDVCGLIFDTRTPFVLRRTAEGQYKLPGEAFFVSSRALDEGDPYPYTLGSGPTGHEDWLEWGLDEKDIVLC